MPCFCFVLCWLIFISCNIRLSLTSFSPFENAAADSTSQNHFFCCCFNTCYLESPWQFSLVTSNFREKISSLSLSVVFLYFFHWSLKKAFLSLLAILWSSAFKWVYLSFSPLLFTCLLFIAICNTSSDNHFAFLHFFFLGMVLSLPPIQCHKPPFIVPQALY